MTDIVLSDVKGGYNRSSINSNFERVEEVVNTELLHLEGGNNVMKQDLDMNSNSLLNVNVLQVDSLTVAGTDFTGSMQAIADEAQVSADASEASSVQSGISAAESAASAVLASGSAVSAQGSLDAFQDISWGSYASEPALSPVGNPATVGDQYFNTTSNIMLVFNGTFWQATSSAVTGVRNEETYTASAGVSTFAITYDPGFVDVYVNGVKLVQDTDYTAGTGTDITLVVPLALSTDTLQAVAYSTVEFGDFGTSAFVDVGTAPSQTPLNSDLGTSATLDTGTGADQLPTNAQIRNPRNRIVNPSMAISQENGDGPTAVGALQVFMSDQWSTSKDSGGSIEAQRGLINNVPTSKVLVTAAVTDLSVAKNCGRIQQLIEAKNVYDLNGKTCTLSLVANVNWTGKLAIALRKSDASRSYVTEVPVVSGLNFINKVITLESDTVLTNDNATGLQVLVGLNNEGNFQTPTINAWQTGTLLCSDASTQWTKTINNYVEITNVDLYAGSVPREFQPNSYAYDLAECKNYWRKSYNRDAFAGDIDNAGATYIQSTSTSIRHSTSLGGGMRTTPIVKVYSPVSGVAGVIDGAADGDIGVTVDRIGENSFRVQQVSTTAVQTLSWHYTANARL